MKIKITYCIRTLGLKSTQKNLYNSYVKRDGEYLANRLFSKKYRLKASVL